MSAIEAVKYHRDFKRWTNHSVTYFTLAMESASHKPSLEAWKTANKFHCNNYVTPVSPKIPLPLLLTQGLFGKTLPNKWKQLGYRVSIAELQRMRLRALQYSLAEIGANLQVEGGGDDNHHLISHANDLKGLIEEYTQAVRDYEYMTSISQGKFDYFVASSERYIDRHVLNKILVQTSGDGDIEKFLPLSERNSQKRVLEMEKNALQTGPWSEEPVPLGGTRSESVSTAPSGFVFVFGFVMVGCLNSLDQVFASTLAYAAVIMVFVGVMYDKQFPEKNYNVPSDTSREGRWNPEPPIYQK
ncbi:hypothetical protein LZ32DRAFT_651344 [Colletotrichum eremochloae]|nr:hypothetical protein LZ32DRAFT_651344 [Colletotrichum eremochloae]